MPHSFTFIIEKSGYELNEELIISREKGFPVVESFPSLHGASAWEKADQYQNRFPGSEFVVMYRIATSSYYEYSYPPDYRKLIKEHEEGLANNELDALLSYLKSDVQIQISKDELFERIIRIGETTKADELDQVIFAYHRRLEQMSVFSRDKDLSIEIQRFFELARKGIKVALDTKYESLVETLLFCLKGLALKYTDFYEVAKTLSLKDAELRYALNWVSRNYYEKDLNIDGVQTRFQF